MAGTTGVISSHRQRSKSLQHHFPDSFEADLFLSDLGFDKEAKYKYARSKSSPPYFYDSLQRYLHLTGYDPTRTQTIHSFSSNASQPSTKSNSLSDRLDPTNNSQTAENSRASTPTILYDSSLSRYLNPNESRTAEHSGASSPTILYDSSLSGCINPIESLTAENSIVSNASPPVFHDTTAGLPNPKKTSIIKQSKASNVASTLLYDSPLDLPSPKKASTAEQSSASNTSPPLFHDSPAGLPNPEKVSATKQSKASNASSPLLYDSPPGLPNPKKPSTTKQSKTSIASSPLLYDSPPGLPNPKKSSTVKQSSALPNPKKSLTATQSSASNVSSTLLYDSPPGLPSPKKSSTAEQSKASNTSSPLLYDSPPGPNKTSTAKQSSASNVSSPLLYDSPPGLPNPKKTSNGKQSGASNVSSPLLYDSPPGLPNPKKTSTAEHSSASKASSPLFYDSPFGLPIPNKSQTAEHSSASNASPPHKPQAAERKSASKALVYDSPPPGLPSPNKSQESQHSSAPNLSPPIIKFHNRQQKKLKERSRNLKKRSRPGSASAQETLVSQDLGLSSTSPSSDTNQPVSSSALGTNAPQGPDPAGKTAQQLSSPSSSVSSGTIRDRSSGTITPTLDDNNVASSSKPTPSIVGTKLIYITFPPKCESSNNSLGPFGCTECYIAQSIIDDILKLPYFCKYEPENPTQLNHRIKSSSIKGLGNGLFANNDMKTGDLVFSERPLLIAPGFMLGSRVGIDPASEDPKTVEEWETKLKALVSRMTSQKRKAFLELADSHSTKKGGKCGKLVGILRTNGIYLPGYFQDLDFQFPEAYSGGDSGVDLSRTDCFAVCEQLSRINHSCSPNLVRIWENGSFSFRISAIRPIAKGEELTIAYIPIFLCAEDRQALLYKTYNFICKCHVCTIHPSSTLFKLNNTVRAIIVTKTRTAIDQFTSTASPLSREAEVDLTNSILSFLGHIEKVGLQASSEYRDLIALVVLHFIRFRIRDQAIKYAASYMELMNARFNVREEVEDGITRKWGEVNGLKWKVDTGTGYAIISDFYKSVKMMQDS